MSFVLAVLAENWWLSAKGKGKSPTRNSAFCDALYLAVMDFLALQLAGVAFA